MAQRPAAAQPVTAPTVPEQARVAVVLYDMLRRGGPPAELAALSAAFPEAAAIARRYVLASSPPPPSAPAPRRGPPPVVILERVNVWSVAWFCWALGLLFAVANVLLVLSLAAGTAAARAMDHDGIVSVLDAIASSTVGNKDLYRWALQLANQHATGVNAHGTSVAVDASEVGIYVATGALTMPLASGAICFALGAIAATSVNLALRVSGGLRFHNHAM